MGIGTWFRNRRIRVKLLLLATLLLSMLAMVSSISVYKLTLIGNSLSNTAGQDIPLGVNASELIVNQLERSIRFNEALAARQAGADAARLGEITAAYEAHGREIAHVEDEIKTLATAMAATDSDPARQAFGQRVLSDLGELSESLETYAQHADAVLSDAAAGADKIAEVLEEQHEIQTRLEALLRLSEESSQASVNQAYEDEQAALLLIGTISATALIAGGLLALFLANLITSPLTRAMTTVQALADGDTSRELKAETTDEVGELARSIEVFRQRTIEANRLAAAQREEEERQAVRAANIQKITQSFEQDVVTVLDAVSSGSSTMLDTAGTMSSIAEETSSQASTVAAASEEASANVATVSAAAEELSNAIAEITSQINNSNAVTKEAVEAARVTGRDAEELTKAAERISQVLKLISDIASQTNLLALNATIEAARAGEMGKGFAVVANEVKGLALQTSKATEEIAGQIADMQGATAKTVKAVDQIAEKINRMEEITTSIASAIEEQSAATQEIARNVEEAATGTQEVNRNVSGVSQAATETGQSATQVRDVALDLADRSTKLRQTVDRFLKDVRAA